MENKYNKDYFLMHYKNCKSFRLVPECINENAELVIGSIDLPLTTKCNLSCSHCGSLIDQYVHHYDVDYNIIISSLDRLLSITNLIVRVNVLGGEPFLYPKLENVLEYIQTRKEIDKIYVHTNGLYLPKQKSLLDALRGSKIKVRISRYPAYASKINDTLQILESEKITYSVKEFGPNDFLWYDYGGFEERGRSQVELEDQYIKCDVEWYSVFNGRIFPCPRAAHAVDLELIRADGNYVDLLDPSTSIEELKKKLQRFFFETKYYPCCDFCDRGTEYCSLVEVAEQT